MRFDNIDVYKMWRDFLKSEGLTEDEYPLREYERDVMDDIREMHHYGEVE